MNSTEHHVTIKLEGYIAHPYFPEQKLLIDILKKSGYNRVRSEDKRESTLAAYLKKEAMTLDDFNKLKVRAARQWYRLDNDDMASPIIIPRHQVAGMLVQACLSAPAGSRFNQDNLRSLIRISDFVTSKTKADDVFERYVLLKDGKGNVLSNQRDLQKNERLLNVEATGVLTFDHQYAKEEAVKQLLSHALASVGVGASRKMGHGRGEIISWK